MSENPKPAATAKNRKDAPAKDAQPDTMRFERRLLIFRATVALGGAAALGYYVYSQRRVQGLSDNDPTDPRGGGKGKRRPNSDSDPSDPERGK